MIGGQSICSFFLFVFGPMGSFPLFSISGYVSPSDYYTLYHSTRTHSSPLQNKPTSHFYTSPPIRALFISSNSILPYSNQSHPSIPMTSHTLPHTHTHTHTQVYEHHSCTRWQTAHIMLQDFNNIAQQNIPDSTAAHTHHMSIFKTFFSTILKIYFFELFCVFPGAPGDQAHHFQSPLLPLYILKFFPTFRPFSSLIQPPDDYSTS